MITEITETQINDLTHIVASEINKLGINTDIESLEELNSTLSVFLFEQFRIPTVLDKHVADNSTVQIRKTRQVSCNANEEVLYEINKTLWDTTLASCDNNAEQALNELQANNHLTRVDHDIDLVEISEEFDVEIEVS